MNMLHYAMILTVLAVIAAGAGCTGTSPPPATPVPSTVVTTPPTPTPVPQPTLYPGALSLGTIVPFGIGGSNGTATVYKAFVRSEYTYTLASFNSPAEQSEAGQPLGTQYAYSTERAPPGTQFVVVLLRLENTGRDRMVAPSPWEFLMNYHGTFYNYTSVDGPDIITASIPGYQYDYLIGDGGVAGTILPGQSNAADGFLIYIVPAPVDLSQASLVISLDAQHRAAWRLG